MSSRLETPLGTHGNAWNNAVTASGASSVVDTFSCPFVTAFGTSDGAVTITLQYSQDGTNFYSGPTQVLAGAGDFAISATPGARFCRLKSSAAVTVTATIAAK